MSSKESSSGSNTGSSSSSSGGDGGKAYTTTSSGTNSQVPYPSSHPIRLPRLSIFSPSALPYFLTCQPAEFFSARTNCVQGNHYCSRDYGSGATNSNSYHYSNTNGSYYYSNPNGSTYYNDGQGGASYNPSGANK